MPEEADKEATNISEIPANVLIHVLMIEHGDIKYCADVN